MNSRQNEKTGLQSKFDYILSILHRNSNTCKAKGGATHRQTVPNENADGQQEGWVSGVREKDPKVSETAWTDVKSDKRQSWQAPAWISVTIPSFGSGRCHHNANASLWWSVPLGAVVQNGCRQANTLVRATECAFFPSRSKEVPSVSDSGASAIYSKCSKHICHFCILRLGVHAHNHRQGCLLSWELLSEVWCIPFPVSSFIQSNPCSLMSITQAAGQNKFSFSLLKARMDKNPILRGALGLALSTTAHEERRAALRNKSISSHLLSYSAVIDGLSHHLFESLDSTAEAFSKEPSWHPKQIMHNSQIDAVSFIELTCLTRIWHLAQLFFISQIFCSLLPLFFSVSG